jgi:hypothetical protein
VLREVESALTSDVFPESTWPRMPILTLRTCCAVDEDEEDAELLDVAIIQDKWLCLKDNP